MLQKLIDESQKCVNGVARVKLYKGHCRTVGRKSDSDSLFNLDFATFEKDKVFNLAIPTSCPRARSRSCASSRGA